MRFSSGLLANFYHLVLVLSIIKPKYPDLPTIYSINVHSMSFLARIISSARIILLPNVITDNFVQEEHTLPSILEFQTTRARVRDSPGKTLSCTLMAPGACKIRCRCNVLQVPIHIISLEILKRGKNSLRGRLKV